MSRIVFNESNIMASVTLITWKNICRNLIKMLAWLVPIIINNKTFTYQHLTEGALCIVMYHTIYIASFLPENSSFCYFKPRVNLKAASRKALSDSEDACRSLATASGPSVATRLRCRRAPTSTPSPVSSLGRHEPSAVPMRGGGEGRWEGIWDLSSTGTRESGVLRLTGWVTWFRMSRLEVWVGWVIRMGVRILAGMLVAPGWRWARQLHWTLLNTSFLACTLTNELTLIINFSSYCNLMICCSFLRNYSIFTLYRVLRRMCSAL